MNDAGQHTDDLVRRAIAATRELPESLGPSAAILSQTSAALREAARRPKKSFLLERITYMSWTIKASAALAIAASGLVLYFVLVGSTNPSRAFAAMLEALNDVRSATWKSTQTVITPDRKKMTLDVVGMFKAPLHERTETTSGSPESKAISIIDGEKDKMVTLSPAMKTATIMNVTNIPSNLEQHPFGRTFQSLRELVAEAQGGKGLKAERLPDEAINGRQTEVYGLKIQIVEVKIWVDPKTLLPIRVEYHSTSPGGTESHIIMTDFHTDVDLDAALFCVDIPEGYTIQQTVDLDMSKKQIFWVAELLKIVAEQNGDVFPPTLHQEDIGEIMLRFTKTWAEKHDKVSPEEGKKISTEMLSRVRDEGMHLSFVAAMLTAMPAKYWHYEGKNVKLNTPDTPIFWLRFPPTSSVCQVLYADLSIKEVPAEQMPKTPSPKDDAKQ
jgi:outer membrane lipoprotein-sorting protein